MMLLPGLLRYRLGSGVVAAAAAGLRLAVLLLLLRCLEVPPPDFTTATGERGASLPSPPPLRPTELGGVAAPVRPVQ